MHGQAKVQNLCLERHTPRESARTRNSTACPLGSSTAPTRLHALALIPLEPAGQEQSLRRRQGHGGSEPSGEQRAQWGSRLWSLIPKTRSSCHPTSPRFLITLEAVTCPFGSSGASPDGTGLPPVGRIGRCSLRDLFSGEHPSFPCYSSLSPQVLLRPSTAPRFQNPSRRKYKVQRNSMLTAMLLDFVKVYSVHS